MNKTILITGGAGFVGTNLSRILLQLGFDVYAVDNFLTGKRTNIEFFLSNPRYHFYPLDITTPAFLQAFLRVKVDEIYHLACPTGVPNFHKLSEEIIKACSIGTMNVMEVARWHNSKVVYASSSEVYGHPEIFPQTETYTGNVDPTGMRSPYEEGKRFSESIVMMYVRKFGVKATIMRLFNVYGPGMSLDDQRVVPQFLRCVKERKDLVVYGDGLQKRTLLYVEDLIAGMLAVMDKGENGQIYNIGSDEEILIVELAKKIIDLTKTFSHIEFRPHFIEDHKRRLPDLVKIRSLGWEQRIDLSEGLLRTFASYKF